MTLTPEAVAFWEKRWGIVSVPATNAGPPLLPETPMSRPATETGPAGPEGEGDMLKEPPGKLTTSGTSTGNSAVKPKRRGRKPTSPYQITFRSICTIFPDVPETRPAFDNVYIFQEPGIEIMWLPGQSFRDALIAWLVQEGEKP